MIDYIPVLDVNRVMNINPEKLKCIDVINEVYIKGDILFGGVINMISRRGDMAGIDLPDGSYFFDYKTFRKPDPDPVLPDFYGNRIPDFRNTFLWIDRFNLHTSKQESFRFDTPSLPGNYAIIVRGISPGGKIYAGTVTFEVK
jgi:hypothetical protein